MQTVIIEHIYSRILLSYELLRGVSWFKTDVSEQPLGPVFKGQTVLLGQPGP